MSVAPAVGPTPAAAERANRPWRAAALVGVGLLTFWLAARWLRTALPLPADSGMRHKWELLERHGQEAEVVVLGSSYTMCSIVPEIVEQVLAARGHDVRLLNVGVPGLLSYEADRLLERLVDAPPPALRLLVLELRDWRPSPHTRAMGERSALWHSPAATLDVVRNERHADLTTEERLDAIGLHAELAGRHATNLGRLSTIGLQALGALDSDDWLTADVAARERGYVALEEVDNPGAAEGHRRFRSKPMAWELAVRALARAKAASAEPDPWNDAPLRRRLALIERAPFEVVQYVGPVDVSSAPFRALVERGEMPPFWAFDDPVAYPGLYSLEARYDERHLMRPAAEQFSRIFAQRLAEHLDAQRAAGPATEARAP